MTTLDVNLLDGAFYAGDPYPTYRRLRDEAPAYWDPLQKIWGISRYDDVVAVEKHPTRYTSSHGSRPRIVGDVAMINNDDPLHQSKRRLVARRFTPRSVKEHEDHVRAVVTDLIDAVVEQGECDVVADLAAPLPARVICELLGFDSSLASKCREWSEVTMLEGGQYHADGSDRVPSERTMGAVLEFATAALELLAARRAEPRDDLFSVWAHSEIELPDGTTRRLDDDAIVHEALLLLDGGAETTRTVIGTMSLELSRNPDQRATLADDPSILATTGVEEFIRWVTPILNMRRTATEDHELHGETIRAGDEILLMYSSANRDERVFEEPETLDVTRQHNHHVAFGFGTHFCLGAALARLELRVMFEELLRRMPDLELAPGAEPRRLPSAFAVAYDSIPMRFTPSRPSTDRS
ncbi:MAG TPA: cytochrome P450 [Acidimicrobiia bacterium]|jgi:cytochrome P450 family 142 subfamily A polypeptide 1